MESKVNYISPDDFKRIVNYIPMLHQRTIGDKDVEMLYKILYFCALRPMEGINLSKVDFNLNDREISLGNTKTRKNDYAPIPSLFVDELGGYLTTKTNGKLFKGLNYLTFYRWLKKTGKGLDIEAWTTHRDESSEFTMGHIFRKTVGKDMLSGLYGDKAKSIPIISKQLRHSKPSMTVDYYLKSSIEAVKDAW